MPSELRHQVTGARGCRAGQSAISYMADMCLPMPILSDRYTVKPLAQGALFQLVQMKRLLNVVQASVNPVMLALDAAWVGPYSSVREV